MTSFLCRLPLCFGLGFLSLPFLTEAVYALDTLPRDGQIFRLEIPTGDSRVWLGAKPTLGAVSFTQVESTATRWRFHRAQDGSYTIESLEDGKRWLTLDPSQSLRLTSSSAALASHWNLSLVDGELILQSQSKSLTDNAVVFDSEGAHLHPKKDIPSSNLILHEQADQISLLSHGDVISVRSLAATTGSLWLDGNTTNGIIGLTTEAGMVVNTGALWRVHDNGDGSYSFECLGNVAGRRWLAMAGPTPQLTTSNDRNEATRWKVESNRLGMLTFENVSYKTKTSWLASYPEIASTAMAEANLQESLRTFFQILVRSKYDPSVQGRWSEVENLTAAGIHTHVLPDGKVLFWSRFMDPTDIAATVEGIVPGKTATFVYDPDTGLTQSLPNAPVDPFCSGHAFLPDGRLLVTGGHIASYVGLKATQIYDYRTNSWSTNQSWDMNQGRWYPTSISLGNGDIITVSGDATSITDFNRIPQVWSATNNQWRELSGLASSCFNVTNGPCMPLYPWLHLSPSGNVFVSGPGQETGYIDTLGEGRWIPIARTNQGYRGDYEATSIMYAPGKILIAGGLPVTNSVETIDLNQANPVWTVATPMLYPRRKHTSTLLADGQVLVSGGLAADGTIDAPSNYASEIWNPETGRWTEADHIKIPRLYHSTAVLLPDGRVLSMGGGLGAGFITHKNMQIYSPPYLFKGPRPTFTAPDSLSYGHTVRLTTPEAGSLSKVHLIRLSSDTHSFNSTQHIVPLDFMVNQKSVSVQIPASSNVAPPGYYLLFIVNRLGVPSLGKTILLRGRTSDPLPIAVPVPPTPMPPVTPTPQSPVTPTPLSPGPPAPESPVPVPPVATVRGNGLGTIRFFLSGV